MIIQPVPVPVASRWAATVQARFADVVINSKVRLKLGVVALGLFELGRASSPHTPPKASFEAQPPGGVVSHL